MEHQTLELQPDYEGRVTATLITSKAERPKNRAVLYLHGFIDYFFQEHLAKHLNDEGYDFYALDLRKYGRSLLPHQHPNYCKNLEEYFEEISRTIEIISKNNPQKLILLGHSTGGLISALYAHKGKYRTKIDALVLNSPFLEFNFNFFMRKVVIPCAALIGKLFPYANIKGALSSLYVQSVHKKFKGEWEFNLNWKPRNGFPAYFRWLGAIRKGHSELRKKLNIACPVLVMHSDKSSKPRKWDNILLHTDSVLNVEHIKENAQFLGSDTTLMEIKDGLHDLFLSRKDVREEAMKKMVDWEESR